MLNSRVLLRRIVVAFLLLHELMDLAQLAEPLDDLLLDCRGLFRSAQCDHLRHVALAGLDFGQDRVIELFKLLESVFLPTTIANGLVVRKLLL